MQLVKAISHSSIYLVRYNSSFSHLPLLGIDPGTRSWISNPDLLLQIDHITTPAYSVEFCDVPIPRALSPLLDVKSEFELSFQVTVQATSETRASKASPSQAISTPSNVLRYMRAAGLVRLSPRAQVMVNPLGVLLSEAGSYCSNGCSHH